MLNPGFTTREPGFRPFTLHSSRFRPVTRLKPPNAQSKLQRVNEWKLSLATQFIDPSSRREINPWQKRQ